MPNWVTCIWEKNDSCSEHTDCGMLKVIIIGASVSEPHTSELNGRISLISVYINICVSYIQCMRTCATYGHYMCASTTCAHLESSVPNSSV